MYYTYQKHFPDCYSLHRPSGEMICFLQGDDAREFEKDIEWIENADRNDFYPSNVFESADHHISVIIDQYDYS